MADERVRLALLLAVLVSLSLYFVTSQTGLPGLGGGGRAEAEECSPAGAPEVASVGGDELFGLRGALRKVAAGRGATLYELGPSASGYMWSDAEPGTDVKISTEARQGGGYELRWWFPNRDDVVADALVFADRGTARDFIERAADPHCRTEGVSVATSTPPGGRNLAWLNPDGFAQEDLFMQRGRMVYRVATVLAGSGGEVTFSTRHAGFDLVDELACALPGAGCPPVARSYPAAPYSL